MTKGIRITFRVLFCLYLAGVLFLCFGHFESTQDFPNTFLGIPMDKVVHFCLFFPFPILAFLAFDRFTETVRATLRFTGITFLAGLLMALGTEWGQASLTTHRAGEPLDLLADTIGLILGSLLVLWLDIRKQRR